MRSDFESAGDVRSVDLLAALVSLWRANAGGSLRFSRPGATAGFELAGGEIVGSLSSQPQFDVAAILGRAGKLDAAALKKLGQSPGGDASLRALQAGLISLKEWRWGQKIRAIEILSDLLGWLQGEYAFDPDARPAAGNWTLPVPRLVLELFLRSRDRTLVEHYLGPSDLPLLRAGSFEREFETFGLTADAGAVVALIDGRASAEEIAERAPAEEFAVLKLLAALTTLGLVHPAEAAPEAGRAAPPAIPSEGEAPEARRGAEPEPEAGLEAAVAREIAEEVETEAESPAPAAEQPPAEEAPPAAATGAVEEVPEPVPEAASEPGGRGPRVPADVGPERLEIPAPGRTPDAHSELEFEAPTAHALLPEAKRRGSGVLFVGLLAVLAAAVAVLLIVRSRRTLPETAMITRVRPTVQENPVFPPAETAVPLPTHGRAPVSPSPAVTRAAVAIPPTAAPTAAWRPSPPPQAPGRAEPTKPPAAPTRAQAPTRPPTRIPTAPEPTRPPTRVPTRPEPARPPTRIPPTAVPTAAAVRGETGRAAWLARAERDRKALSNRRQVRYAIQLELACETPTLEKAWNWDRPAGTMWLLTTSYRGRTCFRVMWGRFASLPEAREARARVPALFTEAGNHPAIVSVR